MRNRYPTDEEKNWYDTAQICPNGHVVNDASVSFPESNKKFCDRCGEPTISTCQSCNAPIQGILHIAGAIGLYEYVPPRFCHACGAMYPWTKIRLDAARELADELTLSIEEKEMLKQSLQDIVQDTPRTRVAATRFKRLVAKAGPEVAEMFRSLIVDIASETAKKMLFP